jgi:hypothetical protein
VFEQPPPPPNPAPVPVNYTRGNMPMGQFVNNGPAQPVCLSARCFVRAGCWAGCYLVSIPQQRPSADNRLLIAWKKTQFPPGSIDVQEDLDAPAGGAAFYPGSAPAYNRASGIPGEIQILQSQVWISVLTARFLSGTARVIVACWACAWPVGKSDAICSRWPDGAGHPAASQSPRRTAGPPNGSAGRRRTKAQATRYVTVTGP